MNSEKKRLFTRRSEHETFIIAKFTPEDKHHAASTASTAALERRRLDCLGIVSGVGLETRSMWQCGSDFHSASRHERRSNYRLRYVNIATCQSTVSTKWLFVQLGVYVSTPFPGTVTSNAQGGHKLKS